MACSCNGTNEWTILCMPVLQQVIFWVIAAMLILSLSWNIFCCVSKYCSGKGICQAMITRRRSLRHMEENPIYGNISYMQTSMALTEVDPPHSSLSSISLRVNQQRVNSDSQSKTQDCYANLTLKAPRVQSGRSSPQIHYSDVVQLEELPPELEKEDEGNTDAVSTMSDLYASVQTQRTKTVDTADSGDGYANHL
ncbi:uncharacterized protein LOC122867591 isoform X3 [Siniperca chuatsi]|uniref:uncharacterized protein LOC122867591 isoform X3 n=1 Tax=Siniperca chuatsi TaxID=119488 RepID=UPI001CE0B2C9|nr:uncharacterized protein LOC122867591 isoform X3 [Siniperca chuatsi]